MSDSKERELSLLIQKLKETYELFEVYGVNLKNMDPIQLQILQLEVSDLFKKINSLI